MLFHHDPMHSDDYLDALPRGGRSTAGPSWAGSPAQIELASERREIDLGAPAGRLSQAQAARRPGRS